MRKNSEEKPIDIISMEEYLKKRQVVRQPETVWEGWRKICQCIETGRYSFMSES